MDLFVLSVYDIIIFFYCSQLKTLDTDEGCKRDYPLTLKKGLQELLTKHEANHSQPSLNFKVRISNMLFHMWSFTIIGCNASFCSYWKRWKCVIESRKCPLHVHFNVCLPVRGVEKMYGTHRCAMKGRLVVPFLSPQRYHLVNLRVVWSYILPTVEYHSILWQDKWH